MRIVSYNILDGGAGREEALGDVIESQRPDVVCLVEADDPSAIERIANRLKMDFIHAAGNAKASALMSRWPIGQTINHAPFHPAISKSLLEATVIDPSTGDTLTFGVLHLHARAAEDDERQREREIEQILSIFRPHREAGRPHVLAGDFNANAPGQRIDPARCKPRTRQEYAQNGGHLPRRVIQRIFDAGYTDSFEAVHPDRATTAGTFTTEFPGQRVDYLFTFAVDPARLREAWIVDGRAARNSSDHFPIGLELAASASAARSAQ